MVLFIFLFVCVPFVCFVLCLYILKSTDTIMKNKISNKQQNQKNPESMEILCFALLVCITSSLLLLHYNSRYSCRIPRQAFHFFCLFSCGECLPVTFSAVPPPPVPSPLCVFRPKCIIEQKELTESNDIPNAIRKQLQHLLYEFSLVFV